MSLVYDVYESSIGNLCIMCEGDLIVRLDIGEEKFNKFKKEYFEQNGIEIRKSEESLKKVITQIDEYFRGARKEFDLNIKIDGTEFQKSVYREMLKIPYGQTLSYSEIAQNINNPKSVRAVGQASKNNKIAIIIPCHRVVGKNNIGGYMGDHSNLKKILINLEENNN